jgi:hypothetical protein
MSAPLRMQICTRCKKEFPGVGRVTLCMACSTADAIGKPFGRVCEHGLSASHSWACYEEEYGESKAELLGEQDDYRDEDAESEDVQ